MPSAQEGGTSIDRVSGLQRVRVGAEEILVYADGERLYPVDRSLSELLGEGRSALERAVDRARAGSPLPESPVELLAPIDHQEVWASGVTYQRSRAARMSESASADVYDRIYDAPRPELFLKAAAWRVTAPGAPLRVRGDSGWDVPEPELALVLTAGAEIAGYLVANDMSSREIEGENPLYLPQAKVYDDALGLSATIVLARDLAASDTELSISLTIRRAGAELFSGETNTSTMHRSFEELVEHLFRELSHPSGAVLLTGTGVVPPDEVTLEDGDEVEIQIEGVGTLRHGVYTKPTSAPARAVAGKTVA
jgi:2-dehydro-3-deoxy-D-arabinonate dehydratase